MKKFDKKSALIIVGTTQFEELIKIIDTQPFIQLLKKNGYHEIVFQIGRGKYIPKLGSSYFVLDPQISKRYEQTDLIICHGGAGTLLECLLLQKKIIAVVNDTLAGNHQQQIVKKLASQDYILGFLSPKELQNGLNIIDEYLKKPNLKRKFKQNQQNPTVCVLNDLVFGKKQI